MKYTQKIIFQKLFEKFPEMSPVKCRKILDVYSEILEEILFEYMDKGEKFGLPILNLGNLKTKDTKETIKTNPKKPQEKVFVPKKKKINFKQNARMSRIMKSKYQKQN